MELTQQRGICQQPARQLDRCRKTMPPENAVFQRTMLMDGGILERGPVLPVLEKNTQLTDA